jgi:hypothetical protein
VNDELVEHKDLPINHSFDGETTMNINYAFTKNVLFLSNRITKTKVEYKAKYGINGVCWIATYLYGSGKGWYNDIGKITMILKNDTDRWIYSINMPTIREKDIEKEGIDLKNNMQWNSGELEIILNKIEPDENDLIEIQFGSPFFDFGPKQFPYSFP